MLLTKGELHLLVRDMDVAAIPAEVAEKLDHLVELLRESEARQ
jgi:hypothetical protein